MDIPEFSLSLTLGHFGKLLLALVLALPVAWEREYVTRMLGLRTLPLVSLAACAFILVGTAVAGADPSANARLLSGLITGIGFIGGGAILKEKGNVRGTATAASIWGTGVLGVAVGYELYELAVAISVLTLLVLLALTPIERMLCRDKVDGQPHD